MADICAVCDRSISFITKETVEGIDMHFACIDEFNQNPEKYGGKAIEKTDDQIKAEVQREEQQQKIEDQSVYVKGFSMPFGEMVGFMVKWALASIPAFIILAIIGGIFFAMFTAIFA